MIWTIWNNPGCHLCHVLFLDSIDDPGRVFILHRERNDNIYIEQRQYSEQRRELPDLMHLRNAALEHLQGCLEKSLK